MKGGAFYPAAALLTRYGGTQKLVSLSEAVQIAIKQFWYGWAIIVVMAFPLTFCMMKSMHYATRDYSSIFLSRPIHAIHDWTIEVYNASPLFGVVWPYLPHLSISPLLSAENLKFAVLLSIFACGVLMRDSGRHLSERIATVRQRAEEKRWERSLTGDLPRPDVLTVQIDLTTKDQWYKRPFGIVLLTVIGGAILLLFGRLLNISE